MLPNTNLATKATIARVEAALAHLEATLKADIAQAKREMIRCMVGIVLGVAAVQTTLIVGLLA